MTIFSVLQSAHGSRDIWLRGTIFTDSRPLEPPLLLLLLQVERREVRLRRRVMGCDVVGCQVDRLVCTITSCCCDKDRSVACVLPDCWGHHLKGGCGSKSRTIVGDEPPARANATQRQLACRYLSELLYNLLSGCNQYHLTS
jgi:hypothetical protein